MNTWDEGLYPGVRVEKAGGNRSENERVRGGAQQRGERILNVQSVLVSRPQCCRKAGFMRGFSHVTWRFARHVAQALQTLTRSSLRTYSLFHSSVAQLSLSVWVFSSPSLSLSLPPDRHSALWFNLLGNFTLHSSFPPNHHLFPLRQTIYSHPSAVRLPLTRGQVCPCVASSNRKCIMDVTFLSISTTKSHSPPCSRR